MNKKSPLLWFIIASIFIIVVSSIIVGVFGVNASIEISGGSQIEIQMSDSTKTGEYVDKASKVLGNHGQHIDSYFVEDKLTDTYLVLRVNSTNIKDSDSIKAEIASALEIDQSKVSGVIKIDSYFANKIMLYIGLSILAIVIVCFFLGWIRLGIIGGTSLLFAFLHSMIMSFALIFLTRVQFSVTSLVMVFAGSIISVFATEILLERLKENLKSKQYSALSENQNIVNVLKQNKVLLLPVVIALIVSLVLIILPINNIRFVGLSLLFVLLSTVYTTACITPALHAFMLKVNGSRQKQKLSTNVKSKN